MATSKSIGAMIFGKWNIVFHKEIVFSSIIIFALSSFSAFGASPGRGTDSLFILKKEVSKLLQKKSGDFPDIPDQEVTVGFLINANNELIILDVTGDSNLACEYVKHVLNYNKVKFNQSKQLTRYNVTIRLVKEKN